MKMRVFRSFAIMAMGSLMAVLLEGCTSPNGAADNTGTGALVGAASGAGLGAIIDRGNPGAGALIGGAAGAITGGLIGHSMDQAARTSVYAVSAPPAPLVENVGPAPGPGYVWLSGRWVWNGSGWAWASGQWALPPYPQAVWVAPGWVRGPNGWYWQSGYWR